MALFKRKKPSASVTPENDTTTAPLTQVEMMAQAAIPVFLSKMHSQHPPRWVTVRGDRLESVVGLESGEYMAESTNHEVWSIDHFVGDFPFITEFLNVARPGQTAFFRDQSGKYTLEAE